MLGVSVGRLTARDRGPGPSGWLRSGLRPGSCSSCHWLRGGKKNRGKLEDDSTVQKSRSKKNIPQSSWVYADKSEHIKVCLHWVCTHILELHVNISGKLFEQSLLNCTIRYSSAQPFMMSWFTRSLAALRKIKRKEVWMRTFAQACAEVIRTEHLGLNLFETFNTKWGLQLLGTFSTEWKIEQMKAAAAGLFILFSIIPTSSSPRFSLKGQAV